MRSPPPAAASLAILLLLLPWGTLSASAAGVPGGAPAADGTGTAASSILWMKAGRFDPASELPTAAPDLLSPSSVAAPASADTAGRVHFILQFSVGVTPRLVRDLAARGIAYERYLPDGGMIASAQLWRAPRTAEEVGARALLPLSPAFKIDPSMWGVATSPPEASVRLLLLLFDAPDSYGALSAHGTVLAFDGRMAIVEAPASHLLAIARLGDVEWVEPYLPAQLLMDQSSRIVGARQLQDGHFEGDGRSLWSYNASTDSFEGLTGRGVIVNIADTGIDETHPAFAGRIVAKSQPAGWNATNDTHGHGTHVAGIVAGNGSWREEDTNRTDGQYVGVAPEAGLVAQLVFIGPLKTTTQLSQEAYAGGAFVNSNSWGGYAGGDYTSTDATYDELVVDANGRDAGSPQMSYIFASGNDGPYSQSVISPGSAKNVITVGATGGEEWSWNTVTGFSSRGPTADGRLKPEVVAPGESITSARTNAIGCDGGWLGCSYWTTGGTSMATPAVAGVAALYTQWYAQLHGARPSAAMVKAALVAGATPLPSYTWPDFAQGWGRVNISRTLNEGTSFHHLSFDEDTALSLAGRTTRTYRFFASSDEELKVVLAWSDVAGTTSSSKALINDLDLEVRAPDGTLYRGNLISGGYSATGTQRDSGNNTEVFRVRAPQRGIWEVTVRAVTIPSGEQRFAVVAQGNVTDDWITMEPGQVEFTPADPREGDPLTVIVPAVNTGTRISGPMDVVATLEGPEGNETQTVRLLGVMQGDDLPAVFHFAPMRGTHTLRVHVDPGGTSGDRLPNDNTGVGTVFVRGYEVSIEVLSAPTNVSPLGSTSFVLRVVNRGNVLDQVNLTSSGGAGWGLAVNMTSSFLDVGDSALVSGAIEAPGTALAGETARFNFTATSEGNASRFASVELAVSVDPFVSLRLTPGSFSAPALPGETVSFTYLAENAGNVEVTLNLSAAVDAAAGEGWSATAVPSALTILPYSNATGSVDVTVPEGARASEVRSITVQPESPQVASIAPITFQVFVERIRAFGYAFARTFADVPEGTEVMSVGQIWNSGNGKEYFSIFIEPMGETTAAVHWSGSPSSLPLDPGGFGNFSVSARALLGSLAGVSSARLRLAMEGGYAAEMDLHVTVPARHALTVSAPQRVVLTQGTAQTVGVSVTNDGNVAETVILGTEGETVALRLEGVAATVTLAPGQSHQLRARVVAAAGAPPGESSLKVVGSAGAGATGQAPIVVVVQAAGLVEQPSVPGLGALAAVGAALVAAYTGRRAGRR